MYVCICRNKVCKRQDFTFGTILTNHLGKRNFLRRFGWLEGYVCESVVGPTAVTEATNIPPVKSLPVILYLN